MSETPVPSQTGPRADAIAARVVDEALALLHVLKMPQDERAEAAARLDLAAVALPGIVGAVARALVTHPALTLPDLVAMLDKDAALVDERAKLAAPDAARVMDPATGHAPDTMAAAYARALANTERAGDLRRVEEAAGLLAQAQAAPDARTRRACMDEAARRMERAERDTVESLADTWAEYRKTMKDAEAEPREGVRLDPRRGAWADWMNRWMGHRAALMPGKAALVGAAAGGGKTSLAAAFAVDALAAGCPVRFHQLELGRAACLEYLFHQYPAGDAWRMMHGKRIQRDMPTEWLDLLDIPADASPKGPDAVADLQRMARAAERARRADPGRHACNGLFILDYAQLLAKAVSGEAFHEALAASVSALVKAAQNAGACLLVLSQVNKTAQAAALGQTAFAGADLARLTDCAFTIEKAAYQLERDRFQGLKRKDRTNRDEPEAEEETATFIPGHGEARLIRKHKDRGSRKGPGGRLDDNAGLWICDAALHGTNPQDAAPTPSRRSMPEDV